MKIWSELLHCKKEAEALDWWRTYTGESLHSEDGKGVLLCVGSCRYLQFRRDIFNNVIIYLQSIFHASTPGDRRHLDGFTAKLQRIERNAMESHDGWPISLALGCCQAVTVAITRSIPKSVYLHHLGKMGSFIFNLFILHLAPLIYPEP